MSTYLKGNKYNDHPDTLKNPDTRIDHRYLYQDASQRAHIVCGIAREALASSLRLINPLFPLEKDWLNAIYNQRDNPAVLGFLVEQRCISGIADQGLPISDSHSIPASTIVPFEGDAVKLRRTGFYVPVKPNCMAIDCVYADIDDEKQTAFIIPIQITIAKSHSDSEVRFWKDWDTWTRRISAYRITVIFLWIKDEGKSVEQVARVSRNHRSGEILLNPEFTRVVKPVIDVDPLLGKALERLRAQGVSFEIV